MLLATRCPFCETVFRLQPEQLTLRRGLVRCGHCKEVFDASSSLFDVSDGVSVDKAKHVTIDDVTAHTLETLANGSVAPAPETKPAVDVPPAPVAVPVVTHTEEAVTPQPAEAFDERVVEPHIDSGEAHAELASAEQHAEHVAAQAAQPDVDVEARHEAAVQASPVAAPSAEAEAEAARVEPSFPASETQPASPADKPDFRAEAWNPWAPAPDASIDRRIRHNASTIPFNPVTIPRSAQPPLTLELTESQPMHLDQAIAREPVAPEPHSEVPVEARAGANVEPAVETQAEPKFEGPSEQQAHQKAEPIFGATPAHEAEPAIHEPPHAWREPESLREPAEARHDQTANETKREAEAPLHESFDDVLRESRRDEHAKPVFEDEDSTVIPSAEHAGHAGHAAQGREREPFFGAPSAEPDLEPRFGAAAREPYNAPFAATPDSDNDAFAVTREPRQPESSRFVWQVLGGVAAGLLGFLLLVQLAWWQRETVMVAWPDAQSLFVKACAHLGCKVEPPRDIDGLLVEPSDLRQVDGPHKLELKMPLRNRFDLALAYPAVELTLLDENNNIAMRRVLWPQDYVKPGTPIAAGLPARTTQTMIVRLDTGDAVASNFRVQIFYP
ncbi:hypothetical protein PPGU19_030030 [Paraburkholderia sp. PGU19]|uniref:DUF3426 domain-containing protein n=1 Tax=Paraburkholderia sp. PGU19 TaxID=2735434 RepID=UPI0015DB0D95|nr:DUF3426 domain-containing protein [Paraburkholderia sp. PGU19]BCF98434.1 hypothetical protein PPGU19_030030 [Paraburkholderia sp. PGU19]